MSWDKRARHGKVSGMQNEEDRAFQKGINRKAMKEIVRGLEIGEVVFFVGAGVSKAPPSNLPLGMELKNKIIQAICCDRESALVTFMNVMLPKIETTLSQKIERIRPEVIFQILYDHIGALGLESLGFMRKGIPNSNHRFLAQALKDGYSKSVLTTNFDCLIEKALAEIGINDLLIDDNGNALPPFDRISIFKLHGTIEKPQSLIATLNQYGRESVSSRAKIIRHFLQNYFVVFVGYSGADLDIYPLLIGTRCRKITWVVRPETEANENIRRILVAQNGQQIRMDLNEFFRQLGSEFEFQDSRSNCRANAIIAEAINPETINVHLRKWADNLNLHYRSYLIARIFDYIGEREWQIRSHQKSLEIFGRDPNSSATAESYGGIATAYYQKGEWERALEYFGESLRILKRLNLQKGLGNELANLGLLQTERGNFAEAIRNCENAISILESVNDSHGLLIAMSNLATIYVRKCEWKRAETMMRRILEAHKRLGDLSGQASTNLRLGTIYQDQYEWNKALEHYETAQHIYESIDFSEGIADVYLNLASLYLMKDDWTQGTKFQNEALKILEALGDVHGVAMANAALARLFAIKHQHVQAIELYKKALKVMESLGDLVAQADILTNLALSFLERKDWENSIKCGETALEFYQRLGRTKGIAEVLGNLGATYYHSGDLEKAMLYYEEDKRMAQRIGDSHGLAAVEMNIGSVHYTNKDFKSAIELYSDAKEIFVRIGDTRGLGETLSCIGKARMQEGLFDEAIKDFEKTMSVFEELKDPKEQIRTLMEMSEAYLGKQCYDKSLALYLQAQDLSINSGYFDFLEDLNKQILKLMRITRTHPTSSGI